MPTNKLRWLVRYAYVTDGPFDEASRAIEHRQLQQWWELPSGGEWRDIPEENF